MSETAPPHAIGKPLHSAASPRRSDANPRAWRRESRSGAAPLSAPAPAHGFALLEMNTAPLVEGGHVLPTCDDVLFFVDGVMAPSYLDPLTGCGADNTLFGINVPEGTTVVEVDCMETWRDFTDEAPEVWVDGCADDPEFVARAIESEEIDQDEVDPW